MGKSRNKALWYWLPVMLLAFFSAFGQGVKIPDQPKFIPAVIDSTGTLTDIEYRQLSEKIINYNDTTSTELLVMVVNTTHGEYIGRYATDIGEKWKIGQERTDNGILFLIALKDRQMWIAPGKGAEGALTDYASKTIIEQEVTPSFKQGKYYEGIDRGVDGIMKTMAGEFKGSGSKKSNGPPVGIILFFILIFIVIIIILSRRGGGGGGRGRRGFDGSDIADILILSSLGRGFGGGGGGSFGGGGGGFGGFGGGGSFGGGGAGGSW